MSAILKVVQGSPEWHAHRAQHRNASETPAVLGCSPWVTKYQLWLQRTGRATSEVTAPMLHGTRLEPAAREAYEQLTGNVMQPLVLVEGEYSASLDGITMDGSLILECKCPFKGRDSEIWKQAEAGNLPEHYAWQVEHQFLVSGAALAHIYVYAGQEGILLEQRPQPERWRTIQEGWDAFMRYVFEDRPPPLVEGDVLVRDDQAWREAAEDFLHAKGEADRVAASLDEAKARLAALAEHTSEKGGGVTVTRFWKAGAVDYKKVPSLAGVDLEPYRGALREEVRITATK